MTAIGTQRVVRGRESWRVVVGGGLSWEREATLGKSCMLGAGSYTSERLYAGVFFFFQAEDGIRDWSVTGVQTCALPIWGRVELSLQTVLRDEEGTAVVVSTPVVAGVVGALRQIQAQYDLAGKVRLADVIRFPGALEVVETDGRPDDERRRDILGLVESALDSLDRMRRAEGENLERDLLQALAAIEAAAARLESASRAERDTRRDALVDRARALRDELGLEEARLYQEVVRLVDRQDVAEELQRLRSHVGQVRDVLREGGPCGKRLDFLAQEMAREANTIGSKSASVAVAREVVDLKGEIERLREQVQNVE